MSPQDQSTAASDDIDTIARLRIAEEIRSLKARYCRSIDLGEWESFRTLFSPSATFNSGGMHFAGRDAIITGLQRIVAGKPTLHIAYLPDFTHIDEQQVQVIWGMEFHVRAAMPDHTERGFGFSHDRYVRDGSQWLVASIDMRARPWRA